MPQVRGLPAHRVWRVPLLQGYEEVRRPWQDEAVVHHAAVHCGKPPGGTNSSPHPQCFLGRPILEAS